MLTNQKKMQSDIDGFWKLAMFGFLTAALVIVPDLSFASGTTNSGIFGNALCNILSTLQGTPAKVIATLAIIFIGISAFFGKLNWGTALLVGVGIAAIFGATAVVNAISGQGPSTGCGIIS